MFYKLEPLLIYTYYKILFYVDVIPEVCLIFVLSILSIVYKSCLDREKSKLKIQFYKASIDIFYQIHRPPSIGGKCNNYLTISEHT